MLKAPLETAVKGDTAAVEVAEVDIMTVVVEVSPVVEGFPEMENTLELELEDNSLSHKEEVEHHYYSAVGEDCLEVDPQEAVVLELLKINVTTIIGDKD
ncbi:hypothetical protein AAF712_016801 [Marasmius tenuissimus]|uniref:Uncharacterized protein n=1 Tax=Marasmius tenuissimus TaxID=585030 RepID=A0ABR2Z6P0_9AGAR